LLSAFFLSARESVNVMMPSDTSVLTCSVMISVLPVTCVDRCGARYGGGSTA
jgi:hypothetical protein